MTNDTQETLARVDDLLKRYDEARALEAAKKRQDESGARAAEQKRTERAEKISTNRQARIAKLRASYEPDRDAQIADARKRFSQMAGEDYCGITCGKCGHLANAALFYRDRLGFDRPPNELQCPACGFAIRRESKAWGIQLTPIQATL